ncbi:MAG: ribonuclease J [Oscillospiraceae bacterium]|nr:ribonuclease J [Oscillospiraceae bacterium]
MAKKSKLKIIPLGGVQEIGKNLTVFEYGGEILVLDCGMAFPDDTMFGVDSVIPDMTYLMNNKEKVKGIVITHGHEDHIGSIPYLLKSINVPVYATRLTIGLIEHKLTEHGILSVAKLNRVQAGESVQISKNFKVEFIRVNHSISDAVGMAITTPVGTVVHTGDFKIDCTPIMGTMIDLARFGELGKNGVLALMSDSTNVERPGYTMSERTVGEKFEEIFRNTRQRIFIATFASNVDRVQQIIDAAVHNRRKVAVSGRSMVNIIETASLLGYLKIPEGTMIPIEDVKKYNPHQLVIVTTGSQGEPMSALSRMAFNDHRQIEITRGDLVIISASPIPGNEKTVSNVINELYKKGADVIHQSLTEVHVSGHACREELKIILGLVKPKYFIPVHGEERHLKRHAELGVEMGIDKKRVFRMEIGQVLEMDQSAAKITGTVQSGAVLVDGYGVGDVGNIVLRDRKHLAEDGIIMVVMAIDSKNNRLVSGPEIITRGFIYMRENEAIMEELRRVAAIGVQEALHSRQHDWNTIKSNVKSALSNTIFEGTRRKPMILPVIMDV